MSADQYFLKQNVCGVKDVPCDKFIDAFAQHLKRQGKLEIPAWVLRIFLTNSGYSRSILGDFSWILMIFNGFLWILMIFWILMNFLVYSIYYYLVWVCPSVCASLDRFWPNDKFQFLGFRIFLGPFFIKVFAKFIKKSSKSGFFIGFLWFFKF